MAAVLAAMAPNGVKLGTTSQAYLGGKAVNDTKGLISELCRQFYNLGWVSGTGGSITIKVHDDSIPKPQQLVVMSPPGTGLTISISIISLGCLIFWRYLFLLGLFISGVSCPFELCDVCYSRSILVLCILLI